MKYAAPWWLPGGNLQTIWPALSARRGFGARAAYRRERWTTPDGDFLDVDWLATSFEVSGGVIRNAVIDAAFQASEERTPITMQHLANGLVNEQRKAGRLIRLEDYAPYLSTAIEN